MSETNVLLRDCSHSVHLTYLEQVDYFDSNMFPHPTLLVTLFPERRDDAYFSILTFIISTCARRVFFTPHYNRPHKKNYLHNNGVADFERRFEWRWRCVAVASRVDNGVRTQQVMNLDCIMYSVSVALLCYELSIRARYILETRRLKRISLSKMWCWRIVYPSSLFALLDRIMFDSVVKCAPCSRESQKQLFREKKQSRRRESQQFISHNTHTWICVEGGISIDMSFVRFAERRATIM